MFYSCKNMEDKVVRTHVMFVAEVDSLKGLPDDPLCHRLWHSASQTNSLLFDMKYLDITIRLTTLFYLGYLNC